MPREEKSYQNKRVLSSKNRLNKKEIGKLREEKLPVLQGQYFGLIYEPLNEKKFSLIVSSKISKKAVERNKIKRIFYDIVKEYFFDLNGHFLFLAKRNIVNATKKDIVCDLEKVRQKIKK